MAPIPSSIVDIDSFHELLSISEKEPEAVMYWISKNLDRAQTLDELLGTIGQNPRYFHFYFEYARQALQKWNVLPAKLIPSLLYLFRNFTSLSKENVNITEAIDGFRYEIIFANPVALSAITTLPVSEIDSEALIRFVRYYLRNYDRNLSLREHKSFLQESINYLIGLKPEELQEIFAHSPEKLFQEFGFSLSAGYRIFFEVTKTEGQPAFASDREIAHIRRISEDLVLAEMEAMDLKTFYGFVDRFRNRNSDGRIHFLGFQNIMNVSENKRFYLSLVYKTRVFSVNETGAFLTYCLQEMEKSNGKIYGENIFSNISVLLDFFSLEGILLFDNVELFVRVAQVISKNERDIYSFEQYLRKFDSRVIPGVDFVLDTFNKIRPLSGKVPSIIFVCFANQLLRHFPLSSYLNFVENEDPMLFGKARIDGFSDLLIATVPKLAHTGYKTQERFLRYLLGSEILPNYSQTQAVKLFASGSKRMRYVLMKNSRLLSEKIVSNYDMRDIREKCFSATVFPIGTIHFIRYLFSKD